MASVQELQQQLTALALRVEELETSQQQFIRAVSPQCYGCGNIANQRKRIEIGKIRLQMDVWVCPKCKDLEAAKDVT